MATTPHIAQIDLSDVVEGQRILLSPPDVGPAELAELVEAFNSGWIAPAGPHLTAFETEVARMTGRESAVAVSSGTAAMHLALLDAGVERGDTVMCSSLTFVGSVSAAWHMGAQLCFIDSEATSWNMDPSLLLDELTRRAARNELPKAVIAVDLYGITADYDAILASCSHFEVPLIVDAAESLGARHGVKPAGSVGRSSIISFNGNKIATASGGGVFLTDDFAAAERAQYLSTQARQPTLHYEHTEVGFNYRLSNLMAAVGLAQVRGLHERIARRRGLHRAYSEVADNTAGFSVLQPPQWTEANYWLSCALVDPRTANVDRDHLIKALDFADIESRPVWKPLHLQPVFSDCETSRTTDVSERIFRDGICLPSGSSMSSEDLLRVVSALQEALNC